MQILFKTCIAFVSLALPGKTVLATELDIAHWWTSGGESAAVEVLAEAFNAGGDTWVDAAVAGGGGVARSLITARILGGEPMGAVQFNHGRQVEELIEAGVMLDLTELAEREGWREVIRPATLLDSCTLNGRIYCAPVNIHSWQWMWVSLKAFESAGLSPPSNWGDLIAAGEQLRENNIVPLAVGQQAWQIMGVFQVLLANVGGAVLWDGVNVQRNPDAVNSPAMRRVWSAFDTARLLADPDNTQTNWSDATHQLITGRAGAQIIGDWAQGEFSHAKQTPGMDYDCLPGLGLVSQLDTSGDAFYFPLIDDEEKTAAQLRLAKLIVQPDVQLQFNLAKGSLPIRADVDLSAANACMRKGLAILNKGEQIIPSYMQLLGNDTEGELNDLMAEFWSDRDMTTDTAHERYVDIMLAEEG